MEDTTSNSSVDEYPIRQDLVRRASNVSSLESFRKEFVRNPSIKKKDGEEIDDAGISMNLQKLLGLAFSVYCSTQNGQDA